MLTALYSVINAFNDLLAMKCGSSDDRDLRGKIIGELAEDFSRRPLEDIASLIADT